MANNVTNVEIVREPCRNGDARVIHSHEKRIKVIRSYLEGVGIRSIERLENISAPMVINLIRSFSKKLSES